MVSPLASCHRQCWPPSPWGQPGGLVVGPRTAWCPGSAPAFCDGEQQNWQAEPTLRVESTLGIYFSCAGSILYSISLYKPIGSSPVLEHSSKDWLQEEASVGHMSEPCGNSPCAALQARPGWRNSDKFFISIQICKHMVRKALFSGLVRSHPTSNRPQAGFHWPRCSINFFP